MNTLDMVGRRSTEGSREGKRSKEDGRPREEGTNGAIGEGI